MEYQEYCSLPERGFSLGGFSLGSLSGSTPEVEVKRYIACVGDVSSHGGVITISNQDGLFKVGGLEVAVEGALHSCPIDGHGVTAIAAVTNKSFCNSKLILTKGAVAGCGATIQPVDRKVYVE